MQQTFKNLGTGYLITCISYIGTGGILYMTELLIFHRLSQILIYTGIISLINIILLFGALMHILGP